MGQPADSLLHMPEQPGEERPRRKRRPAGGLECLLGLLLGLCGLAATRLGQLWIAFDVFSHFTLQFAVVTVGFLVGLAMPRLRLLAATVIIVLGLVGIGVWPHVASREPRIVGQAAAGERALKVATFNSFWFNANADAVRAEVERLDADIIALVELGPAQRPILDRLKSRYPHQHHCLKTGFCGIALLSKLPIAETAGRGRDGGPSFLRARLGPEAGGLTVFAVHTNRFPRFLQQFGEMKQLATLIGNTPGPHLVMGDFNATPFSRTLSLLPDAANVIRLTNLPSWPAQAGLPQLAIDHIFVSPGIRLLEAQSIGQPAGSDHYPVALSIAVPVKP